MKKAIKKELRRARRHLCQYIVGFDTCPAQYMKNRKQNLLKMVALTLTTIITIVLFALFTLWTM